MANIVVTALHVEQKRRQQPSISSNALATQRACQTFLLNLILIKSCFTEGPHENSRCPAALPPVSLDSSSLIRTICHLAGFRYGLLNWTSVDSYKATKILFIKFIAALAA
jgi:hypothetical protein